MLYILNYFLGTFNPEVDVIGVEGINKTVGPLYWWVQPTAYHLGKNYVCSEYVQTFFKNKEGNKAYQLLKCLYTLLCIDDLEIIQSIEQIIFKYTILYASLN